MDLKEMRPIAEKLFADIRELTFDGVGVSRESYGAKESATADYLRTFAREGYAANSSRVAAVNNASSRATARRPASGDATISGVPLTGVQTTGVPQAIASSNTFGQPSRLEASTSASAAL